MSFLDSRPKCWCNRHMFVFNGFLRLSLLLGVACLTVASVKPTEPPSLKAVWNQSGSVHELKSWSKDEISRFRQVISREKDPRSREIAQWEGVLLSNVIDSALSQLSVAQKAQIDLATAKQGELVEHPDLGRDH